jgi:hypothetical protein
MTAAQKKKISSFRMLLILNHPVRDENLGRNLFRGVAATGIGNPSQNSEAQQHDNANANPSRGHVEHRRAHHQSDKENHKPNNVQRK